MCASMVQEQIERIAKSNDRLAQFEAMGAPEIILRNERRVLQDAIQAMREAEQPKNRTPIIQATHVHHAI